MLLFFQRTASSPQCPENGTETGHLKPIPGVTLVYVISGRSNNTALLNFGSRLLFKHVPLQFGKLWSASGSPGAVSRVGSRET